MGFFSALTSLFSSKAGAKKGPAPCDAVEYNGFSIVPAPMPEGGQYRIAATITKGSGEDLLSHQFIRSDVVASRDECISMTVRKAKVSIDQSGDSLFS